jgi:hypothetical protein
MLGIRANKTMKNTINDEPNASNLANAAAAARRESRTMKRPNLTVANNLEFANRTLNLKPYVVAAKTLRNKTRNNLARLKDNRNEKRGIVKTMKLKRILSNNIKQNKIKQEEQEKRALSLGVPLTNIKAQNRFFKAIANKKLKIAAKEEARLKGMESGIKAMQIKHAHNLELEKERWSSPEKYREWLNDNKIIIKYMEEVRYFDRGIITKGEATSRYYKIKYTDDDEHRTIRSLLKETGSLRRAIRYYEQNYKGRPYLD